MSFPFRCLLPRLAVLSLIPHLPTAFVCPTAHSSMLPLMRCLLGRMILLHHRHPPPPPPPPTHASSCSSAEIFQHQSVFSHGCLLYVAPRFYFCEFCEAKKSNACDAVSFIWLHSSTGCVLICFTEEILSESGFLCFVRH